MSADHHDYPSSHAKRALDDDSGDATSHPYVKRSRSDHGLEGDWRRQSEPIKLQHADYTVGWICALPIELAVSQAMLDHIHQDLPPCYGDTNAYILGSIGTHKVVMACLPSGQYGTTNAAAVASNMMRSFPSIHIRLMVGIGGGVPGDPDIRLGDIVVGDKVVQHDLGKIVGVEGFKTTGTPIRPPHDLLKAVSKLRAIHEATDSLIPIFLEQMFERYPKLKAYQYPESCDDRLFRATYEHAHTTDCSGFRGICDYSDSHKNKEWQRYASAAAAAYAKELVSIIIPNNYNNTPITDPPGISTEDLQTKFRSRRQSLLQSLQFDHIDSRRAIISTAHLKTCEWLLQDGSYLSWINSSKLMGHHGFLWISGKPGAGKSTIMKFIFNRTLKTLGRNCVVISFFFNARGGLLEKTVSGLYRSLLLQLLDREPGLQSVLDDLTLIPLNHKGCPAIDTLQELFREAIMALGSRQLICFVDALDECDEAEVRKLVVYFEGLEEMAAASNIRLKICFSSRHYPHIDVRRGLKLTLENQPGHRQDLRRYVEDHLRAGEGLYVENIRSELLRKAGGVFMWVVLVVEILNKEFLSGRRDKVERRLQEIPPKLSELFKDILRRDNDSIEEFLLCCQWILFAKRSLRPREWYFAMLSGLSDGQDGPIPYDPEIVSDEDVDLFVNSSSKGLAEITKSTQPIVQFIHESVMDFLVKENGLQHLQLGLEANFQAQSHNRLKYCCNSYITKNITEECQHLVANRNHMRDHAQDSWNDYPFLGYAVESVLYHAEIAAEVVPQDDFIDKFLVSDWLYIANHHSLSGPLNDYAYTTSLLYILADLNMIRLLEDNSGSTPLLLAIINANESVIRVLLASGANSDKSLTLPNSFQFADPQKFTKFTANILVEQRMITEWALLLMASRAGLENIIDLVVNRENFFTDADHDGAEVLQAAASGGHSGTVDLLISKGAGKRSRRWNSHGLLHQAILDGTPSEVRILLRNGADVDAPDPNGETPLYAACSSERKHIVRILLENGADVDTQDASGRTSLHAACKVEHKGIVKILLDHGADVNIEDDWGLRSACIADKYGNDGIKKLLIEKGAVCPGKDGTLYSLFGHGHGQSS
ncbi:putative ankyrin repeat protein [Colletotrichum siamense]|uniref:putative ankyrin repeat protein n=1 Tax=Colletotrichum siamense TaxID=690259 RepID=UPI0018732443|nr:putative ankyrin repeat protein [Colletotrichum siamense]KAF5515191.1 putative ankyrin repeat protein [Colletotrichum siamense]